jgi:hypothetical protein
MHKIVHGTAPNYLVNMLTKKFGDHEETKTMSKLSRLEQKSLKIHFYHMVLECAMN